jgi:dihydroorotase
MILSEGQVLGHGKADLLIEDGLVARIAPPGSLEGPEKIDCSTATIVPGFVDLHAHLREPGREDAETIASGSEAAAAGGFVAVVAMPNTDPPADCAAVVTQVRTAAEQAGRCRVLPAAAISVGRRGELLSPMAELAEAGVRIFTDDGSCVADSSLMRRALEYARAFGGVIANHAEDPSLCRDGVAHEGPVASRLGLRGRPPEAEEIIVARDLALARATGGRLHIPHVSTAAAVDLIRSAKAKGTSVTAEVTPHHLFYTEEALVGYDPVFRINPPLREKSDVEALREALVDGTIDCVATDHAPHAAADKERELDLASPGVIGLETAFAAVRTAVPQLDLDTIVERMSGAPARVLGMGDELGGPIAVGRPANLTVLDPDAIWDVRGSDLRSRARNCPWIGERLRGRVRMTVFGGRVSYP